MKFFILTLLGVLLAASSEGALAQSGAGSQQEPDSVQRDLETIKADLDEVKKELKLILELLSSGSERPGSSPQVWTISIRGNPILGNRDAPLTLIEFSDYQCPFCGRFTRTTLPTLKAQYIDTGTLRYVFRDYPIDRIHPFARKAAEAAECSRDQNKYWEMHDLLFQNQGALQVEKLKEYAVDLGLDPELFNNCLESEKYASEVQRDFQDGARAKITGTPAFFIGKTGPDETIEGTLISGAKPIDVFHQAIENLLGQEK